ncbi:MAG: MFS transporter [Roseivivax sp.]|nr:MFS transporter [Roseivivax sp.]
MTDPAGEFFEAVTDAEASEREARNGLRHMLALSLSKIADGLIDPKLVLSWLLTALGAPGWMAGALVPVREAGALLPQLALAGWVRRMPRRKWAWIVGASGQCGAALVIAAAPIWLDGEAAGWVILAALAVLAVSRAAASVSYKDVLGKTVGAGRRGAVTGLAGSVSAAAVIAFALALMAGGQGTGPLALAVALAGALWLGAALVFRGLDEPASPRAVAPAIDLSPLWRDAGFRRFVMVRGLLTATALAPPYLVLIAGTGSALSQLGALVLASAVASLLGSYVWGRLSDRSSRHVLAIAGLSGAVALAAGAALGAVGKTGGAALPAVLFALMLAYHGVRQARSTYLVDMAPEEARATYAALANTAIGGLLLLSGALGGVLSAWGPVAALAGFAALSAVGGLLALGLPRTEG